MHKNYLLAACISAAIAVMLGAFGAHALKEIVDASTLQVYETAVRYQFYHSFALLAVGILYKEFPVKQLQWAGSLFIAGILLFSGSLYLLCAIRHLNIPALWVGAITPLGGGCFITGWLMLAYGISLKKVKNQ